MRGSWYQSPVGRSGNRFADSFRGWFGRFGTVTHFVIWLTAVMFGVQLVTSFFGWDVVEVTGRRTGFLEYVLGLSGERFVQGFLWQPVSYMVLHDGIWHILVNLLMLWVFGREVEYFVGPKAFAKLYVLAGLLGGALWLLFNMVATGPLVGASAAVLGCVIAFATLFPERELTFLVFFVVPVTLRAKYVALIAIAFDVVPLLNHQVTNVAHLAHLGGAAVGYVYIKALGYGVTPRWLAWLQNLSVRRQPKPAPKPEVLTSEEFMRQKVDPILDKISREGMQSLTRAERKILESAKDLLQKQRR